MAYTKHTWLARLGTGLTKFLDTISGNTLDLQSTPDSVTQVGTPISAAWLNEMEQGIYDGNALILTAAPTTSTVGAVGQTAIYNGAAYICTAAQNNVYTWTLVAPTHTEISYTGNNNTATMCADVYGDGRFHLYGKVTETRPADASVVADGALYRGTAEVIPIRQSYNIGSAAKVKSVVVGGYFTPVTGGTAHLCGMTSYPAITVALGYLSPEFYLTTNLGASGGATLSWYYDIWGKE